MVERSHGVVGVGCVRKSGIDSSIDLVVGGVSVSGGDDHALAGELFDERESVFEFGSEGDEFEAGVSEELFPL